MVAVELLLVLLLAWIALSFAYIVRRRRREFADARWEPHARALPEGGHVVELVCRGEPPQTVRRISGELDWDELGTELAEAMAEAEARAATLNSIRR